MNDLIAWLAATGLSRFIAGHALAFPLLEVLHVLAIALVLGTVFIFDLRLLGWGWRPFPAAGLLASLRPLALLGFAGAVFSGLLLFVSQPATYLANTAFQVKLVLLVLAGVNALWFIRRVEPAVARWEATAAAHNAAAPRLPWWPRLSAAASLLGWTVVLVAGRFVGFTLQP